MVLRIMRILAGACFCLLLILLKAEAGELIVHNGGTVIVKAGSVLFVNCNNFLKVNPRLCRGTTKV